MFSIEIKGYKSIKHLKLDLLPINILIGANGAGKSNILSFFEFLDNLYNQKLQDYVGRRGGIRKFLFNGSEVVDYIFAKIVFDEQINSYAFQISPSVNSFVIAKEILGSHDSIDLEFTKFSKEAQFKFNGWYRTNNIQKQVKPLRKYHFYDTGAKSPFNQSTNVSRDSLVLYDNGKNLAAILYKIKEENNTVYNRIIKTIQSVIPHFSNFILEPDKQNNIVLYWKDKYSNYNYDITDFSDGSIRFIALTVLFLQPYPPKTIIIDELELGLHPFAIAKLAELIQSVASAKCQVIIATQSADLIANFQPQDIIAVDNIQGETKITRLDNELYKGWLEEYTLDELWKKNIINKAQPNF